MSSKFEVGTISHWTGHLDSCYQFLEDGKYQLSHSTFYVQLLTPPPLPATTRLQMIDVDPYICPIELSLCDQPPPLAVQILCLRISCYDTCSVAGEI
jgi:hypothetical protein